MVGYLECVTYSTAMPIKTKITAAKTDGIRMARIFCCTQQHFESSSAHRHARTPQHLQSRGDISAIRDSGTADDAMAQPGPGSGPGPDPEPLQSPPPLSC